MHTPSNDQDGFQPGLDIGLANWLQRENISSSAVTRLLQDERNRSLVDMLTWTSAEQLRAKIQGMGNRATSQVGEWYESSIEVDTARTVGGKAHYQLRYRKVEDAVRFFLGHEGFGESLIFEPHQLWSTDCPEKRIYGDMASADGWWQMQEAIGIPGATVVPLIIASDKTQVTNHQGDLAAHAVYLTIGNLPAHIRNSNDRPGTILLAMLPVVKEEDAALRSKLFHECLRMIFDPVMAYASGEGLQVACADGWTRRCFPVIAAMALDYEEQVKITGVKM